MGRLDYQSRLQRLFMTLFVTIMDQKQNWALIVIIFLFEGMLTSPTKLMFALILPTLKYQLKTTKIPSLPRYRTRGAK